MFRDPSTDLLEDLRAAAIPIADADHADHPALLQRIGQARIVLLGEATHGTHEFYAARAAITRRLVEHHGFRAVAVEADWPDALRVSRFVRGRGRDATARDALASFTRFPLWMWRNTDTVDLITWLRAYNASRPEPDRAGFYGLDLYSLYTSIEAVIAYLDTVDPAAAQRARHRYSCFEPYGHDPQRYGMAAGLGLDRSCEDQAVAQLADLRARAADYLRRDGLIAEDELFFAEQNARLAANAEEYYRAMFRGRVSTWNLRDTHMADTLDALLRHLSRTGTPAKAVVWAHNSHLGDARATEAGDQGELNLGQLARERHGRECFSLGFSTYSGSVAAATEWGGRVERKKVRHGLPGGYEDLLHRVDIPAFLLPLAADAPDGLGRRLQRAIGVIYRPDTERQSHYFHARLADQFDAVMHFDITRALAPLDHASEWEHEAPETYPTGL